MGSVNAEMMLRKRYRYLSQVRQELAMRLLARVYAGGPTPSKVIHTKWDSRLVKFANIT